MPPVICEDPWGTEETTRGQQARCLINAGPGRKSPSSGPLMECIRQVESSKGSESDQFLDSMGLGNEDLVA